MVYGSFDKEWLQNTLGIRPIFSCNEIYWSPRVNEALSSEIESGDMTLSYLVLNSLDGHFSGKWGDVPKEDAKRNDANLKAYFNGDYSGILYSSWSNDRYSLSIITFNRFCQTEIMFTSEYNSLEFSTTV